MRIFITSLKTSLDRRARQERMFKSHGVDEKDFEFVDAVDFKDFDSIEQAEEYAKSLGYSGYMNHEYPTLLFACMSQIKTLERMYKEIKDGEYAIYMEDDIDLLWHFDYIQKEFESIKPYRPDAVHLFTWNKQHQGARVPNTRFFTANQYNVDFRSFCVIYSKECIGALISEIKKYFIPLDSIYYNIRRKVNLFFAYPAMAIENETCLESTFHDMDKHFFKKKFLSNLDKQIDKEVFSKPETSDSQTT